MKITVTTIEASAEDLAANRSVADALMDAISRVADIVTRPVRAYTGDTVEQEEEEE